MKQPWTKFGVFALLSAITLTGFYYVNFDEEVGYDDTPFCEITVFEDLDDLERQRYDGSNISVSGFIELNNSSNNELKQEMRMKEAICSDTKTKLSKTGNITGKLSLNVSSYGRDYYRNEADEIIDINADIAT